jgi:hypothetical protein
MRQMTNIMISSDGCDAVNTSYGHMDFFSKEWILDEKIYNRAIMCFLVYQPYCI